METFEERNDEGHYGTDNRIHYHDRCYIGSYEGPEGNKMYLYHDFSGINNKKAFILDRLLKLMIFEMSNLPPRYPLLFLGGDGKVNVILDNSGKNINDKLDLFSQSEEKLRPSLKDGYALEESILLGTLLTKPINFDKNLPKSLYFKDSESLFEEEQNREPNKLVSQQAVQLFEQYYQQARGQELIKRIKRDRRTGKETLEPAVALKDLPNGVLQKAFNGFLKFYQKRGDKEMTNMLTVLYDIYKTTDMKKKKQALVDIVKMVNSDVSLRRETSEKVPGLIINKAVAEKGDKMDIEQQTRILSVEYNGEEYKGRQIQFCNDNVIRLSKNSTVDSQNPDQDQLDIIILPKTGQVLNLNARKGDYNYHNYSITSDVIMNGGAMSKDKSHIIFDDGSKVFINGEKAGQSLMVFEDQTITDEDVERVFESLNPVAQDELLIEENYPFNEEKGNFQEEYAEYVFYKTIEKIFKIADNDERIKELKSQYENNKWFKAGFDHIYHDHKKTKEEEKLKKEFNSSKEGEVLHKTLEVLGDETQDTGDKLANIFLDNLENVPDSLAFTRRTRNRIENIKINSDASNVSVLAAAIEELFDQQLVSSSTEEIIKAVSRCLEGIKNGETLANIWNSFTATMQTDVKNYRDVPLGVGAVGAQANLPAGILNHKDLIVYILKALENSIIDRHNLTLGGPTMLGNANIPPLPAASYVDFRRKVSIFLNTIQDVGNNENSFLYDFCVSYAKDPKNTPPLKTAIIQKIIKYSMDRVSSMAGPVGAVARNFKNYMEGNLDLRPTDSQKEKEYSRIKAQIFNAMCRTSSNIEDIRVAARKKAWDLFVSKKKHKDLFDNIEAKKKDRFERFLKKCEKKDSLGLYEIESFINKKKSLFSFSGDELDYTEEMEKIREKMKSYVKRMFQKCAVRYVDDNGDIIRIHGFFEKNKVAQGDMIPVPGLEYHGTINGVPMTKEQLKQFLATKQHEGFLKKGKAQKKQSNVVLEEGVQDAFLVKKLSLEKAQNEREGNGVEALERYYQERKKGEDDIRTKEDEAQRMHNNRLKAIKDEHDYDNFTQKQQISDLKSKKEYEEELRQIFSTFFTDKAPTIPVSETVELTILVKIVDFFRRLFGIETEQEKEERKIERQNSIKQQNYLKQYSDFLQKQTDLANKVNSILSTYVGGRIPLNEEEIGIINRKLISEGLKKFVIKYDQKQLSNDAPKFSLSGKQKGNEK